MNWKVGGVGNATAEDEAGGLLPLAGTSPLRLAGPAISGTVATALVALGASQRSSPFATKLYHAWFFGIGGPFSDLYRGTVPGLLAVFAGIGLLIVTWYRLTERLRAQPGVPVTRLVPVFAAWGLPLLVGPPLFSQDIYAYAGLGAMVAHGLNPYHAGIDHLGPTNPYVYLVDPRWADTHTPYGPAFLGLAGLVAIFSGLRPLATVVGLRIVEAAATCALAYCVVGLAREYGRDPAGIFALAMLNPLTLLELVGGGHNDPLMLCLLAAGMLAAKRGRVAAGVVLCTLAAAIKYPAALGVLVLGWGWAGRGVPWQQRVRPLVTAVLIAVAVMEVLGYVTGLGWGWLATFGAPGTVQNFFDPATGIGMALGGSAHALGLGFGSRTAIPLVRGVGETAAVVFCLALAWWSPRFGRLKALGLSLLVIVVLGPVIQSWYVSWAIVMLAPVVTGRLRKLVVVLSVVAGLMPLRQGGLLFSQLGVTAAVAALAGLALVLAVPVLAGPTRQALGRLRSRWDVVQAGG